MVEECLDDSVWNLRKEKEDFTVAFFTEAFLGFYNLPYNWGRSLMAVWKQQNADAYWKTKKEKNFLNKELLYMV